VIRHPQRWSLWPTDPIHEHYSDAKLNISNPKFIVSSATWIIAVCSHRHLRNLLTNKSTVSHVLGSSVCSCSWAYIQSNPIQFRCNGSTVRPRAPRYSAWDSTASANDELLGVFCFHACSLPFCKFTTSRLILRTIWSLLTPVFFQATGGYFGIRNLKAWIYVGRHQRTLNKNEIQTEITTAQEVFDSISKETSNLIEWMDPTDSDSTNECICFN